jgi:hypothetical protein
MNIAAAASPRSRRASGALLLAVPLLFALEAVAGGPTTDAATAAVKWPADDALRNGMAAIRSVTLDNHTLVTHRRMPPEGARKFAAAVKGHIADIRSKAKVPVAAEPALGALLDDIGSGAEAVAGRSPTLSPIDGIVAIDAALARYPRTFDDPDWKPLR